MVIGKLLVQKGILDGSQLRKALSYQKKSQKNGNENAYLGRIIVELGFTSEKEVIDAINSHYGLNAKSLADNIEDQIRHKRRIFIDNLSGPRIPIWLQLSVASIFIILVTILSMGYVILNQQKAQLYRQTVKIGMVSLNYFTNNARIPLLEDNILRLNTLIKEASKVEGIRYAIILDQKDIIKAHTNHNQIGEPFVEFKNPEKKVWEEGIERFEYFSENGERILNLSSAVQFRGKQLGEVHVGVSLDFIRQLVREKSVLLIGITSVIIFFGIIIAVLLGLNFSRPVSKLVLATQEISKGNYQYRVELIRNDELGNLAMAFNQMSRDLWIKSMMQESFGKYVGNEVLEMIMENPQSAWLKGKRSEATVLLVDIRGFTNYSDNNEPETVVGKLNEYFEITSNTVLKHGGYIDKFIGDAVLAVFGVPVYHGDHVKRAVYAAIDIQNNLKKIHKRKNPLLNSAGISINTGVVVSGNIGSQIKMEYTVIGDTVNVASRLNSLAGPGEIVLTQGIFNQLSETIKEEKMPPQIIKGKKELIVIYKLISLKEK